MGNFLRIKDDLLIVKGTTTVDYESHASEWNALNPLHRVYKKDGILYFCELVEEAILVPENEEKIKPKRKYTKKIK